MEMKDAKGFYWTPDAVAANTPASIHDSLAEPLALLADSGANTVMIPHRALNKAYLAEMQARKIQVVVDFSVFAGQAVRQAYPDSVPIDAGGVPFEHDDWYVPACPNHPELRAHQLQTIAAWLDLHGKEVAGLWLDFIRFPVRWELAEPRLRDLCFCKHCLNLFLQRQREHFSPAEIREEAQMILHERKDEWVAWKCDCIVQFVRAVRGLIEARELKTALGMFSLPWRRNDLGGAIRTVAGQDLGRLAGMIDAISPMVYHKLCHQPPSWIKDVTQDVFDWTQKPTLPIIQSLNLPVEMATEEMEAALAYALDGPGEGVMIFTLGALLGDADKAAVVRAAFAQ